MENMVDAGSRAPVPLSLLRDITNGFSEARLIGDGRFGAVYKGVLGDGHAIAVRKLYPIGETDDVRFQNEVASLAKICHVNVVRLLAYCYEQEQVLVPYKGKHVFALETHRALCFEYVPNGSLHHHISDTSCGLDWNMRYAIINGICQGLRYLHEGSKCPVLHMDLKPSNILLDENMTPKISDFGLSRLIGEGNVKRVRTVEYMPPEFIERQVISSKCDIFSLGVIILKLMVGERFYSEHSDISHDKFIELALAKWRVRLQEAVNATLVGRYSQQVRKCLEMALKSVNYDRHKRPSIREIVDMLSETETSIPEVRVVQTWLTPLLIDINLLELRQHPFVFSYSLQLKNRGDDCVAFMLVANGHKKMYIMTEMPLCGVVPPRSANTLTLTNLKQTPLTSSDSSDFLTLYSATAGQYDLLDVEKDYTQYENFFRKSDKVQVARLKVICDLPAAKSAATSPEDHDKVSPRNRNDGNSFTLKTYVFGADEHGRKTLCSEQN